jgi:hypothetical protein
VLGTALSDSNRRPSLYKSTALPDCAKAAGGTILPTARRGGDDRLLEATRRVRVAQDWRNPGRKW